MSRCILRLSWLPPSSLSSLLPVGEGSGNAGVCAPGQRCPTADKRPPLLLRLHKERAK